MILLFGVAGAYAVIGNLALYVVLKNRGCRIHFALGGLALVAYLCERPGIRSRALDYFAVSIGISVVLVIGSAFLLYPRVWS